MSANQPLFPHSSRQLPSDGERHRLLVEWNSTSIEFQSDPFVANLIAQQAHRTPDATALEYDGAKLTYAELEERSNKLANHLIQTYDVGPDAVVALFFERSIEMLVGLLGVLKAGAAYLPLDVSYPSERLAYMLCSARSRIVLTQEALEGSLPQGVAKLIRVDSDWEDIEPESERTPHTNVRPENLAYVIYTSGSTGVPKGVMIPHRALTNHMLWMRDTFPLRSDDVVLQKTPLSFDASVWEVLAPLICGAKLVIAKPNGHKDPAYLSAAIRMYGVTTLQLVPSMLRLLLKEPTVTECRSLRNVFSGGEALTVELSDMFFERLSAGLHNLYGPTETCIQAVVYSCNAQERCGSSTVPIGRPIANTQVYVLDDSRDLVPIGVEGELYIGGAGLARGYCGGGDLTRERFVDNPFGDPGARLYRTGDAVRYLPDGNLEFLGRADAQIKLSGQRVELGEIEALLMTHPAVRESAVAVAHDSLGNGRLIAHVVASDGSRADVADLRTHLAKSLPGFMVPSQFVCVSRLPRLTSGKLDRNALVTAVRSVRGTRDVAQMSPTESALADIWAAVLEAENIGVDDDFFDLGGSSLQLLHVFSQVNERFGTSVGIDAVSRGATLAAMASIVDETVGRGSDVPVLITS